MLNTIQLMGRLTQDPSIYINPNPDSDYKLCRFSIAVQRDYKGQNGEYATDFFNVVTWNKLAKFVSEHFSKGQLVTISGNLRTRKYVDKEGKNRVATEIVAEHIYFTSPKSGEKQEEIPAQPSAGLSESEEYSGLMDSLNNLPDDEPYPFF